MIDDQPTDNQAGPAAILIGPPGAGKTTVGALLADRLGVAYLDTDASVEAVAGKPVADIFVEDGEPAFRKLEHEAVAAALGGHDGVVGLGGGAVLDERTPGPAGRAARRLPGDRLPRAGQAGRPGPARARC